MSRFDRAWGRWVAAVVAAGVASVGAAGVASAATLTLGTTTLTANDPEQTFPIRVTGSDAVAGANFYVQIGDGGTDNGGTTVAPAITAVTMLQPGSVFATDNTGESPAISPDRLIALDTLATQSNANGVTTVPAAGVLAYVTVDTTGFAPGTSFTVSLGNVASAVFGSPQFTTLISPTSSPFTPAEPGDGTVPAATITLVSTAVPEPVAAGLLAPVAAALLGRRRRAG